MILTNNWLLKNVHIAANVKSMQEINEGIRKDYSVARADYAKEYAKVILKHQQSLVQEQKNKQTSAEEVIVRCIMLYYLLYLFIHSISYFERGI